MEAFFRNFKADGVEQPHKLFTGSWRLPTAAQYLGLSSQALDDSVHSYVLVKLDRTKVRFLKIRLIHEGQRVWERGYQQPLNTRKKSSSSNLIFLILENRKNQGQIDWGIVYN